MLQLDCSDAACIWQETEVDFSNLNVAVNARYAGEAMVLHDVDDTPAFVTRTEPVFVATAHRTLELPFLRVSTIGAAERPGGGFVVAAIQRTTSERLTIAVIERDGAVRTIDVAGSTGHDRARSDMFIAVDVSLDASGREVADFAYPAEYGTVFHTRVDLASGTAEQNEIRLF